jgi:hypothetical protein
MAAKILPFGRPPQPHRVTPPQLGNAMQREQMHETLREGASQNPQERMRRGDLRKAVLVRCECSYQFYAPVAKLCPKCRSERLTPILEQELDYTRA